MLSAGVHTTTMQYVRTQEEIPHAGRSGCVQPLAVLVLRLERVQICRVHQRKVRELGQVQAEQHQIGRKVEQNLLRQQSASRLAAVWRAAATYKDDPDAFAREPATNRQSKHLEPVVHGHLAGVLLDDAVSGSSVSVRRARQQEKQPCCGRCRTCACSSRRGRPAERTTCACAAPRAACWAGCAASPCDAAAGARGRAG